MKNIGKFFLFVLIFFSCHHEKKNDSNLARTADSLKKVNHTNPFISNSNKKGIKQIAKADTAVFEVGTPEITPLPFGFKPNLRNFVYAESYFITLLSQNKSSKLYNCFELPPPPKHKVYRLPTMKSIAYIPLPINKWLDTGTCYDGKPFSEHIKLKGYQYRLPDIYNYHCYYYSSSRYYYDKEYDDSTRRRCQVFLPDWQYGYFILYDQKLLTAKVFTIFLDTEYDWLYIYRFFYIDKSYNIQIYENSASLESDRKPKYPYNVRVSSILPNGEIKIKRH